VLIVIGSDFYAMAAFHFPGYRGEGDYGLLPLAVTCERRFSDAYDHCFGAI
jgi:hypothetical protein